jgi:hypothetical protein
MKQHRPWNPRSGVDSGLQDVAGIVREWSVLSQRPPRVAKHKDSSGGLANATSLTFQDREQEEPQLLLIWQ